MFCILYIIINNQSIDTSLEHRINTLTIPIDKSNSRKNCARSHSLKRRPPALRSRSSSGICPFAVPKMTGSSKKVLRRSAGLLQVASLVLCLLACRGQARRPPGIRQQHDSHSLQPAGRRLLNGPAAAASLPMTLMAGPRGLCVENKGHQHNKGNDIQMWTCNGGDNQQWELTPASELRLKENTDFCLHNKWGYNGLKKGNAVNLWECNGSRAQKWTVKSGGSIAMEEFPDWCLRAGGMGDTLVLWECNDPAVPATHFDIRSLPFEIKLESSENKCLDNNGGFAEDGNNVNIWECNGEDSQTWTMTHDGSISLYANPGKCIDNQNGFLELGNNVALWECNGSQAQQWRLTETGLFVLSSSPSWCMDNHDGTIEDGNNIALWLCDPASKDAQVWNVRFRDSESPSPSPVPSEDGGKDSSAEDNAKDSSDNGNDSSEADAQDSSDNDGEDSSEAGAAQDSSDGGSSACVVKILRWTAYKPNNKGGNWYRKLGSLKECRDQGSKGDYISYNKGTGYFYLWKKGDGKLSWNEPQETVFVLGRAGSSDCVADVMLN